MTSMTGVSWSKNQSPLGSNCLTPWVICEPAAWHMLCIPLRTFRELHCSSASGTFLDTQVIQKRQRWSLGSQAWLQHLQFVQVTSGSLLKGRHLWERKNVNCSPDKYLLKLSFFSKGTVLSRIPSSYGVNSLVVWSILSCFLQNTVLSQNRAGTVFNLHCLVVTRLCPVSRLPNLKSGHTIWPPWVCCCGLWERIFITMLSESSTLGSHLVCIVKRGSWDDTGKTLEEILWKDL